MYTWKGDQMKAILSSKMFKYSTRKDTILAAINDPKNKELLLQLGSYLDKPYQKPEYIDPDNSDKSEDELDMDKKGKHIKPSEGGGFTGGGMHSSELGDMAGDMEEFDDMFDEEGGEEPSVDSEPEDDIEESAKITGIDDLDEEDSEENPEFSPENVRNTLESVEDVSEISRVEENDDELWLYYKDKINLNNIMEQVISIVKENYSDLEFNRLARTENAIVFSIGG